MKKVLFYLVLFSVFSSCDPADNRLKVKNGTSDSILFRLRFQNEIRDNKGPYQRSGIRSILPYETIEVGIFNQWEGEFERAKPDTLLLVIAMKKSELDSILLKRGIYNNSVEFDSMQDIIWDSLYKAQHYKYHEYSLQELNELDWQITYTNERFKEGKKR
ncbi:hypothetical protein [Myroides sp. TSA_177.3]|uniref:hypothetical protein n=1 Tax=Myroides sp. TSA_177.3 TaxID=3415650 RepID=UPI00404621C4